MFFYVFGLGINIYALFFLARAVTVGGGLYNMRIANIIARLHTLDLCTYVTAGSVKVVISVLSCSFRLLVRLPI
jgi:hypothetical protein